MVRNNSMQLGESSVHVLPVNTKKHNKKLATIIAHIISKVYRVLARVQ